MTKIKKSKDDLGQLVIYVQECNKFSYEFQKDMPKLNKKHMLGYIKRKNAKKLGSCIIIIYRRIVFYVKEQWERDTWIFTEGKVSIF